MGVFLFLVMSKVLAAFAFGAVDTQLIHISQKCIYFIMYFIIATEKYTLNVYFSVTMIMEPVEWVSFVLIMFKVVFLGAFGVVETANLYFSDNCHLYFFDYEI